MARRYVLVVEDNPDICALLGRMIASYQAEVLVALDVADAVEKARTFPVHLALVDVILYEEHERGYQVITALRNSGLRSPVYVMTGVPADKIPAQVRELADGVLAKPFTYAQLRSVLEKHLGAVTSISRESTLLRDVLGMMTSVATEQEEIRRQQERLAGFMMVLQRQSGPLPAELEAFRASVERYEQGLERIQQVLEEVQLLLKHREPTA